MFYTKAKVLRRELCTCSSCCSSTSTGESCCDGCCACKSQSWFTPKAIGGQTLYASRGVLKDQPAASIHHHWAQLEVVDGCCSCATWATCCCCCCCCAGDVLEHPVYHSEVDMPVHFDRNAAYSTEEWHGLLGYLLMISLPKDLGPHMPDTLGRSVHALGYLYGIAAFGSEVLPDTAMIRTARAGRGV